MNKDRNNALQDYKKIFSDSWTYDRMTGNERGQLMEALNQADKMGAIKGTYHQRAAVLNALYYTFLTAIGYTGNGWRDPDHETAPQF